MLVRVWLSVALAAARTPAARTDALPARALEGLGRVRCGGDVVLSSALLRGRLWSGNVMLCYV